MAGIRALVLDGGHVEARSSHELLGVAAGEEPQVRDVEQARRGVFEPAPEDERQPQ